MKTKTITCFVLLILCVALSSKAQTVQYVTLEIQSVQLSPNTVSYAVSTNQIITLVGTGVPGVFVYGSYYNGAMLQISQASTFTSMTNIQISTPAQPSNPSLFNSYATFKIETPSTENVITNYVPADAIVIPTSATAMCKSFLNQVPTWLVGQQQLQELMALHLQPIDFSVCVLP